MTDGTTGPESNGNRRSRKLPTLPLIAETGRPGLADPYHRAQYIEYLSLVPVIEVGEEVSEDSIHVGGDVILANRGVHGKG